VEEITSPSAPTTEGSALSQAIKSNGFVYTWGQTPRDPDTWEVVGETMAAQTEQVVENISAILNDAVKSTVFITDMNDYEHFNDVYKSYFDEPYPARSVVKVAGLSTGVRVEIEMVAQQ